MNTKFLFFLAIVGLAIAGEEDVLQLTDKDLSSRISDIDATLVMFYVPWSEECIQVLREYPEAGELLREYPNIVLAQVNCAKDGKQTCLEYEILDYPSLKIFRRGIVGRDYYGLNTAAAIAKYMVAEFGPVSRDLQTLDDIEKFLKVQETAVVGFFETETELHALFFKYAENFKHDLRFGHSNAAEVLSKYNETNGIAFFREPQYHNNLEPNFVIFKGSSMEELFTFIKANRHGLVGYRTRQSIEDFSLPHVIAYYHVDFAKNPKATNYWRHRILKVAKEFSGDFVFAVSNKYEFEQELTQYSFDSYDEKPLIVARDKNKNKYVMSGEFSVENLQQFVSDLKEGKLEVYVKSEPIPNKNDKPVKIAVAKNFDEIVINNGKDTLIEFYAPWCGYCQKFGPEYYELGMEMAGEDVDIVKFDCISNEVPSPFLINMYPTLFWLPKNSKHRPIRYDVQKNGQLTKENLIKYIAAHATDELKKYDRDGRVKKIEL